MTESVEKAASIIRGFITLHKITGENLHEQSVRVQTEYAQLVNELIEAIDAE